MHTCRIHVLIALALLSAEAFAQPVPAIGEGNLGLYSAADFRLADGACNDCATIQQALWYFKGEALAAPKWPADYFRTDPAQQDVASWLADKPELDLGKQPPLVWLGSGQVAQEAMLSASGMRLEEKDGTTHNFAITPKIPTNLSYWNDDTYPK